MDRLPTTDVARDMYVFSVLTIGDFFEAYRQVESAVADDDSRRAMFSIFQAGLEALRTVRDAAIERLDIWK